MSLSSMPFPPPDRDVLFELVTQSPSGVVLTDPKGKVIIWNTAMEQVTGIPSHEALGQFLWDVQFRLAIDARRTPQTYALLRAAIMALLQNGTASWANRFEENPSKRTDGAIRTLQSSLFALPSQEGFQIASIVRDITEEQHLINHLNTVLRAVEQSPVSIAITDSEGKLEYANPNLLELTGYTLGELQGKNPRIFQSGFTPRETYVDMWNTIKSGHTWRGQLLNQKKDGELFWEEMNISPVYNEQGQIIQFVAVKEDVTARKVSEQALRESEERFRTTFEQAAVGLAHIAPNGRFLRVNQKLCDMLGYTRDEMLQKSFQEITHPDDLPLNLEAVGKMVAGEIETHATEKRYIRQDGSILWAQLTSALISAHDGTPSYFVSVIQDISVRHQALLALQQSELTLKQSQAIAHVGDWTWNLETNTVRWSDEMCRIFGINPTATPVDLDAVIETMIHPDDRARVVEANQSVMVDQHPAPLEYRVIWPDGSIHYIWAQPGERRVDEFGNIVSLSGIVQDITSRKKAEREIWLHSETQAAMLRLHNCAANDEQQFVEAALEEALRLTESRIGCFQFTNLGGAHPPVFVTSKNAGEIWDVDSWTHLATSDADIWADCISTQKPIIQNHYVHSDNQRDLSEGRVWLLRHMNIPVITNGQVVALMGVCNKITNYEESDATHLTLLSTALWSWIERKRAETRIKKTNRELAILNRLISLTVSTLDIGQMLQIACAELEIIFKAERVCAAILDESQQVFQCVAESTASGNPPKFGVELQRPDNPVAAYLETHSTPLVLNQPTHPVQISLPELHSPVMFLGLKAEDRLHGIISIEIKNPRGFADDEVTLAASIVQAMSSSFETSLLHQRLAEHNTRLAEIVEDRTRQLQRLNDRMATILDNTSDAIVLVSKHSLIENSNLSFDQTLGYTYDELFGQSVEILVTETHREDLVRLIHQTHIEDKPQRLQVVMCRKNGQTFDADIAIAHVRDNDGHVVCSIRDITHLKDVERVKDQFVSMVSHELRTPVSAIMLTAEQLNKYYERMNDEQKRHKLGQIHQQSAVLTELMNAILDITRFEARRSQRRHDPVDVKQTLVAVLEELAPQAEAKMQHIEVFMTNSPIQMLGDYTDISRVWRNLIGNAIKYAGEAKCIKAYILNGPDESFASPLPNLNLSQLNGRLPTDLESDRYVVGIVQDNGPGISAEDLSQLFTRFFRGWAAGTNIPGTGLGLPLVKEIVQSYQGDIVCVSELQAGTTFCFWLPLEKGNKP